MSRICKVCNHPKRLEIDRQLVQGISHTKISLEFDVSVWSVRAHAENHLSRQLVKSYEMKEAMQSGNLLIEIEELLKRSKHILNRAERDGKLSLALNAIRETRGTLELMSKIAVTLHQIRAQELQVQQVEQDDSRKTSFQQGLELLNDTELDMLLALTDKMAGKRKDDVIKTVLEEAKSNFTYHPPNPKHSHYPAPEVVEIDEEWTEEREQQAQKEESALALEAEELEPYEHKPLDLDTLNLSKPTRAGAWGRKKDDFKRAVDPGSIRTDDPQLRRLLGID